MSSTALVPFLALIAADLVLACWIAVTVFPGGEARTPRLQVLAGFLAWLAAALAVTRTLWFQDPAAAHTPAFAPVFFVVPLVAVQLLLVRRWPPLRAAMNGASAATLIAPQIMRAAFGLLLLVIGARGWLPESFASPSGRGDLVVGATAIIAAWLAGRGGVGRRVAQVWNVLAAVEMLGVLACGAQTLLPWAIAEHRPLIIGTLPLFAVPIFLALHVLTAHALARPPAK